MVFLGRRLRPPNATADRRPINATGFDAQEAWCKNVCGLLYDANDYDVAVGSTRSAQRSRSLRIASLIVSGPPLTNREAHLTHVTASAVA